MADLDRPMGSLCNPDGRRSASMEVRAEFDWFENLSDDKRGLASGLNTDDGGEGSLFLSSSAHRWLEGRCSSDGGNR